MPEGKIFALEEEATTVAGDVMPNPLTLRVEPRRLHQGESEKQDEGQPGIVLCARIGLRSQRQSGPERRQQRRRSDHRPRAKAGPTPTTRIHPTRKRRRWCGMAGNIVVNPRNGLYGAIIVGPKGSQYRDPVTGADLSQKNAWRADVIVDASLPENVGKRNYRDVALFFQDEDNIIGTSFMPYVQNVAGLTSVNYRAEPYKFREEQGCSLGKIFQPCVVDKPEDPATPLIEAHAGDPIRIHVIGANSEQNGMFGVEGHEWPIEPYMPGADMISVVEYAGSEILDVFIRGGAGGPYRQAGDFVWSNNRLPYTQSGQWGYLRVLPAGDHGSNLWGQRIGCSSGRIHPSRKPFQPPCGNLWWELGMILCSVPTAQLWLYRGCKRGSRMQRATPPYFSRRDPGRAHVSGNRLRSNRGMWWVRRMRGAGG